MSRAASAIHPCSRTSWLLLGLIVALSCLRFAHVNLLWADEDYHLAAALQILHGRVPYRDFWYDKPPASAIYYLLIRAFSGWPLRLLDAAYVLVAARLAFSLARACWSEIEGWFAALGLAFFLAFYLPAAVIPFAVDALMLVPQLAALFCANRKRPLWAGLWCGIAFLVNIKAVFVFATCAAWFATDAFLSRNTPDRKSASVRVGRLAIGFAVVLLIAFCVALSLGAWPAYLEQVWRWGLIYAQEPSALHPIGNGILRTADWLGFHAVLVVAAVYAFPRLTRDHRWKFAIWLALSYAGVSVGARFVPRYFLQLLPALVIIASRGLSLAVARYRTIAAAIAMALALIPLARFGPRYASLSYDDILHREPHWSDIALGLDSQHVARKICRAAHARDTLFVWGYRPDIYVYTRMLPDSRFWDSQPLTGVPADRHLFASAPILSGPAAKNRAELAQSNPDWIVDGLGLLNPKLRPAAYPELRAWLSKYRLVARTSLSLIYRRAE